MKFSIVEQTRLGARMVNQDRVAHWRTDESLLMVVADGLGGHPRGEVAAEIAVRVLGTTFEQEAQPKLEEPELFLLRALWRAHAAILRETQTLDLMDTPRTVLVACVVQDGHAYWTHIGDCRLYLYRQGRLAQRTRDHTLVQQLVDEGQLGEEALSTHPDRNRLLQCLGGYQLPRLEPVGKARLAKDDVLVLCSDGFWAPLTPRQFVIALATRPLADAIGELVALAEARAGRECDNISVAAMAWGDDEIARDAGPALAPDELPTDVQDLSATDLESLRMSDEDIEKAIAEIRAALRKNLPPQ